MSEHTTTVEAPVAKMLTVWAAVGITSWADAAAAAAFFYSLLLITEWFWKKFWRDIFIRNGWFKRWIKRKGDDHG